MSTIRITSIDSDGLQAYRDLKTRKTTSPQFIVEGKWLTHRLLDSNLTIESLLVAENHLDEFAAELANRDLNIPLYAGSWEVLRELVGYKFHRGVMACGRRPPNPTLESLVPQVPATSPISLVVCIDIQDAENLGGILRNASAFGATGVLVGGRSVPVYSRRVLRVSMGTVFQMPIRESEELEQDLRALTRQHRVTLIATSLSPESVELSTAPRPDRYAILLGNEAEGLGEHWLEGCDHQVRISMHRGTDSLNVATTSGVVLYHYQHRPD